MLETSQRCTAILFFFFFSSGDLFIFFLLIFIGVRLLYSVVLTSAAQQNESAVHIQISPPFWTALPFRLPQCIR